MLCPLCENHDVHFFAEDKNKRYKHCNVCDLVFVEEDFLPDQTEEKLRYDEHQNTIEDKGYVAFLSRIIQPLQSHLNENAIGLDFGSGPNPVLAKILKDKGYEMEIYDPYFAPDLKVFDRKYDFITATEVVEHMHNPAEDYKRMFSVLEKEGVLALMTKLRTPDINFTTWHYKNDLTHVSFYSPKTVQWIGNQFHRKAEIILPDLIFFI
ncbi:MAG TPA: class I SAM-dependent methyltransferase [Salinivirga sp.]|uniref:class I SAM-dependent methyltransferase n=1 Tax=Salinivirga sp. TaxID=1970192 RepID=UPI002B47F2CA|nr:class I SAM-dependent methyltransferase [Salinivirga sp.]HKK58996.1 class I SAM-dependent methyltransferase [Salinivirga sp.]